MRFSFALLITLPTGLASAQQTTVNYSFHSNIVNDEFNIYVTSPDGYNTKKKYSVVYYMDADIKAGKELREMLKDSVYEKNIAHTVFIGIGQDPKKYVLLRDRDFTTPYHEEGDSLVSKKKNYGQIENFYQFLRTELMPGVEKKYHCASKRTVIGHSLGGLFVFYCLFKQEKVFQNFIALSPSLWVNNYNIYKFEEKYHAQSNQLNAWLYLSCGSLEVLNKIIPGNRQMNALLKKRDYKGLTYEYQELQMENHNSEVEPSLDYVLKHCVFGIEK